MAAIGRSRLYKGGENISILDFFKRSTDSTESTESTDNNINPYITEIIEKISKDNLLAMPTVTGCVEILTNTIASLPIELYKISGDSVKPVKEDNRVTLLNDSTGDLLDAFEFKKAMLTDYLLHGSAYGYINRRLNDVTSIHYIDRKFITVMSNTDPIFKHVDVYVNGEKYHDYDFIRMLRKTKDGATGVGILEENFEILKIIYTAWIYEGMLVGSGGNKKGFIMSQNRLSKEAKEDLKAQWNNMYTNNKSNCVVLNDGLTFQESANTSVEMQINENKKTNSAEICKMFQVPESVLNGTCTDEEYQSFIKLAVLPLINAFENSLNVSLLTGSERNKYYFKFDTKELMKGDIEKRMKAYAEAVKSGIMQVDEVRYLEDLKPLGLDFIKLGLQDVLYNPVTKEIYTPNTNQTNNITNPKNEPSEETPKGGELKNEDRDKTE